MNSLLAYTFWVLPFLLAMGSALALVLLLFFASSLSSRWSAAAKLTVIIAAAFIGESVYGAMSGRLLYNDLEIARNPWLGYQIVGSPAASLVKKAATAVMLLVSGAEVITWLLRRSSMHRNVLPLYVAFAFYYLAMVWVSAAFGVVREFSQAWFYAPVVFTALALLAPEGLHGAVRYLRWMLVLGLLLSVLPGAIELKRIVETGYEGSLIGLPYRLHGAASHANSFGAVALILLLLELSPWVVRRINWINVTLALTLLVLSQSKANWVALLLGAPLVRADALVRFWRRHAGTLVVAALLMLSGAGVYVVSTDVLSGLAWPTADWRGDEAFTGRGAIWAITWDTFLKHPLFGYGPALWDPVFRNEFNWSVAGHAHNQFLQVLGRAGIFGAVSWLLLMVRLGQGVWREQGEARWLGMALLVALLCRSWTEAPMEPGAIAGIDGLGYLLVFIFAAAGWANARQRAGIRPRLSSAGGLA